MSTRRLPAGIVLGIGMGGSADGIAFHQIAQWHNMGSAVLPPVTLHAVSLNMLWDGLFHATMWSITLIGIFMLWRALRTPQVPVSSLAFTGELMVGWGAFNLGEGLINHHLLHLHHVRDMPVHVVMYDWVFLAVGGMGLLAAGTMLMRPARRSLAA